MKLTDSDAQKAIAVLLSRRRIRPTEVAAAVRAHDRMVKELRQRLAALEGGVVAAGGGGPERRAGRRTPGQPAGRPRQKRVSAERKAAMVRQGKYLAAIGRLSAGDRAKVKAVRTS